MRSEHYTVGTALRMHQACVAADRPIPLDAASVLAEHGYIVDQLDRSASIVHEQREFTYE